MYRNGQACSLRVSGLFLTALTGVEMRGDLGTTAINLHNGPNLHNITLSNICLLAVHVCQ